MAKNAETSLPPLRAMWLVFAGGALGSVLRFLTGELFDTLTTLFVVNLLGAAFLGVVNGFGQAEKPRFATADAKWFWGAGFSGGFTTMSGLATVTVLMGARFGFFSVLIVVAQMMAGLMVYAVGFRMAKGAWPSV